MSADNWAKCPSCYSIKRKAWERDVRAKQEMLKAIYGNVSSEEYLARVDEPVKAPNPGESIEEWDEQENFREDYEIYGAEDGVIQVHYSGCCGNCGLSTSFTYEHPLDV